MGGKKPIKIIQLYNSGGLPFEACIGAKIDPLLEVDYLYSILAPRDEQTDPGKRVSYSLSYHSPARYKGNNSVRLPAKHFHIKVDNPPHIRYTTHGQNSSTTPERDLSAWVSSNRAVLAKPNPLCPELVEEVEGISNLNLGALVDQGVIRLVEIVSQSEKSTLFYVELLLDQDELCRHCEGCQYGSWESIDGPRFKLCAGCRSLNVAYCSKRCRNAHWKGMLDGKNWWWPPHKLVCGMNTEAALGTTRLAEDGNTTKNKENAAGNGWTSRSF